MIHLLFLYNTLLKLLHIILLNKVLLILKSQRQYNSLAYTLAYTPAQNSQTQNIQTALTIITLHFNAIPNYTTSRNLSRPPLQAIPAYPLSYSLTSTNPSNTHFSTTNNNQHSNLNPFPTSQSSIGTRNMLKNTQFQTYIPPSTTIRTYPHINTT